MFTADFQVDGQLIMFQSNHHPLCQSLAAASSFKQKAFFWFGSLNLTLFLFVIYNIS